MEFIVLGMGCIMIAIYLQLLEIGNNLVKQTEVIERQHYFDRLHEGNLDDARIARDHSQGGRAP